MSQKPIHLVQKVVVFPTPRGEMVGVSYPVSTTSAVFVADPLEEQRLQRLDRRDLSLVWVVGSGGRYWPRLALEDGYLLANGDGREIAAFDVDTGRRLWSRDDGGGITEWRGRVLVSWHGDLEFIAPATGETGDRQSMPIDGVTELVGDLLVIIPLSGPGPAGCWSLVEERLMWRRNMVEELEAYPGVDPESRRFRLQLGTLADRFLLSRGGGTFACSVVDGRILWHVPLRSLETLTAFGGRAYVLLSNRFVAIDEATGEIAIDVVHEALRSAAAYRPSPAVEFGRFVVFAMESGHLVAFAKNDGSLAFVHKHRAPLWLPVVLDDRLLVPTSDGQLLVFEKRARH